MSTETTPELLSRLEREHVRRIKGCPCSVCSRECQTCKNMTTWPCDTARLVAHARSLEAAHYKIHRFHLEVLMERDVCGCAEGDELSNEGEAHCPISDAFPVWYRPGIIKSLEEAGSD